MRLSPPVAGAPIAFGFCQCGCGGLTTIAAYDSKARGAIKGQPRRFIMGHNGRKSVTSDYRKGLDAAGRRTLLHRLRAEAALGKSLPAKAVVHHVDGTKRDTSALVICENQAYHMLLHARIRIKARGGNPNTDAWGGRCRRIKSRAEFSRRRGTSFGVSNCCRQCSANAGSLAFQKRKQERGAYWRKTSA